MAATQNVLRHYNIETTQKGADFIALAGVVSMIAGTRIAAYRLRLQMEAEARKTPMASNVVRMSQQSAAPQSAPQQFAQAPSPRPEPSFDDPGTGF